MRSAASFDVNQLVEYFRKQIAPIKAKLAEEVIKQNQTRNVPATILKHYKKGVLSYLKAAKRLPEHDFEDDALNDSDDDSSDQHFPAEFDGFNDCVDWIVNDHFRDTFEHFFIGRETSGAGANGGIQQDFFS